MTGVSTGLGWRRLRLALVSGAVWVGAYVALASSAEAVTVTFQEGFAGYVGTIDTFIRDDTHADHGTDQVLRLRDRTNDDEDILMRFDLSPIPSGQVILSATLTLNKESGSDNSLTVTAYPLTAGAWSEGDGFNATAGHADWNHRIHPSTTWTSGDFSTSDYDLSSGVGTIVTANGLYSWDLTAMTQAWYAAPGTNIGLAFVGSGGNNRRRTFSSSEKVTGGSPSANRPKLTVTYAPIPEPASLLLFGLGGLGLAGPRRRPRGMSRR